MWKDTDTDFLDKQLAELRPHRRVVSNRLSSALFYGAAVGCEIGVYGDPMILEAERAVLGGMERQKRLSPELHQVAVPRDVAAEVARVELGTDLVLAGPELISVLGWQHARRAEDGAVPWTPRATCQRTAPTTRGASADGTDGWTSAHRRRRPADGARRPRGLSGRRTTTGFPSPPESHADERVDRFTTGRALSRGRAVA